jgi:hypothetical protein
MTMRIKDCLDKLIHINVNLSFTPEIFEKIFNLKNEHDCLYFMNKYNNTNGNLLSFYSSLDVKNRTLFSKWVNDYNIE